MHLLFIGSVYDRSQISYYTERSKRGVQFASHNLQEAMIEGLIDNDINLHVLSLPSLSSYPVGCKIPKLNTVPYTFDEQCIGKSLGFWNVPFLKTSLAKLKKEVTEWCEKTSGEKTILFYSLQSYHVRLACYLKAKYPDISLIMTVADLPEFMGSNKYYKKFGFQKRDMNYINNHVRAFDGFVLLSPYMRERLNIGEKPSVTMEGIYIGEVSQERVEKCSETFDILYTGNLNRRYGGADLVNAFCKVKNDKLRLMLCGWGDTVSYIKEKAKEDNRIQYLGVLQRDEIIKLQKKASLLVNPRHSNEVYTRYSFPSKTMEYMASGIPTLMSPLQCMPEEYKSCLYFFEDESVEGMARKLQEVCEIPQEELNSLGASAAEFIRCFKTPKSQMRKVITFLDSLCM